ncbi:MAG: FG-GAP repeat protein [Planctomycetota bacterium]|nr:FG-GAP repeat protein [Planctomycetota bacterium]
MTAGDGASSDRFGQAVDLTDCYAMVGAHLDNHAVGTDAGAVYAK